MGAGHNKDAMVTHTAKLNGGNPTDSLETQSTKVFRKNSVLNKSWWVDRSKIKEFFFIILQKKGLGWVT